jgi:hypothetical protein
MFTKRLLKRSATDAGEVIGAIVAEFVVPGSLIDVGMGRRN